MDAKSDYYSILGVSESSSYEEIKKSYHDLIRRHHPDKIESELKPTLEKFLLIEEAWKVLGDQQARTLYDAKRILENSCFGRPVDEELTLKNLDRDEDKGIYKKQCRCGGWFRVTDEDIAKGGLVAIECDDCSLSLLVDCDMDAKSDYYSILGVSESSSYEEIKKSYHDLIRRHHPNKIEPQLKPTLKKFLLIEEAWKVLGDQQARTLYDAKRILENSSYGRPMDEELTLKNLDRDEDKGLYKKQCCCGGWLRVTDEDTAKGGFVAIECDDCCLSLLVDCDVR